MPDQDYFDWKIHKGFHGVAAQVENADVLRCADALERAIAAHLRRRGGLPGLANLAADVREGTAPVPEDGRGKLGRLARAQAQALVDEGTGLGQPVERAAAHVIDCVVREVAEEEVFAKMRRYVIGDTFKHYDDAAAFQKSVLDAVRADKIASHLLVDPAAERLRSPSRRVRKARTPEVLERKVPVL